MKGAATVAVLVSLAASASAEETPKLKAKDRVPFRYGFLSPTSDLGSGASLSDMQGWVTSSVEKNTDHRVTQIDPQECRARSERLTCLVEASSEAWRAMKTTMPESWSEVEARLAEAPDEARFLLVVSQSRIDDGDRLAALLIDVTKGLHIVHEGRNRQLEPGEVEQRISSDAVIARPAFVEVKSRDQALQYVEHLVTADLRPMFEGSGRWRPFGSIVIELPIEDPFQVIVDGMSLGTVSGRVVVEDVRPGTRTVSLENADFEPISQTVNVATGDSALVRADPVPLPSTVGLVLRSTIQWTGVGAAAVGAGIVIYSIAKALGTNDKDICIHSGDGCESRPEFYKFGSGASDVTQSGNGGGPPIAPLGYSLAGLGLVWSLGPLIFGGEDRIPWIEAIVGAVVFGVAYGVSVAADGQSPHEASSPN